MNKTYCLPVLAVMMTLGMGLSQPAARAALTPAEMAIIEESTWWIWIDTDVRDLYQAGIQYALLDEDPLRLYQANLGILRSNPKIGDEALRRIVAWNAVFEKVNGVEVGLLPPISENQFSLRSNGPEGKKWLVTKVANRSNGEPVCWSLPVQVKKGGKYRLRLDETNYLDLKNF